MNRAERKREKAQYAWHIPSTSQCRTIKKHEREEKGGVLSQIFSYSGRIFRCLIREATGQCSLAVPPTAHERSCHHKEDEAEQCWRAAR